MELHAIEMGEQAARQAFVDYRRAFQAEQRHEDEVLMRGYREIAKGKRVIVLRETISAGGVDRSHRPKLAVARADWQKVFLTQERNGSLTFASRDSWRRTAGEVNLGRGTVPQLTIGSWTQRASSPVPIVPPTYRPRWAMHNYHILFEARWTDLPKPDPALLKSLGGGLYAVLAVWDMTPLERAVLGMRLS